MSLDQPDALVNPTASIDARPTAFAIRDRLLAACKAAEDLLTRCEVDVDPNIAAMQATDLEWDAVHAQLREAIAMAAA